MNINKTITLTWEGKEYSLLITMRHIDHIEANGINLLAMVRDCASGELKMGQSAKLIAILLQIAGAASLVSESLVIDGKALEMSVSLEEAQTKVWAAMCADGEASIAEVITVVSEILGVFFFRSKKKSTVTKKKTASK